jgi:hypothetical protein
MLSRPNSRIRSYLCGGLVTCEGAVEFRLPGIGIFVIHRSEGVYLEGIFTYLEAICGHPIYELAPGLRKLLIAALVNSANHLGCGDFGNLHAAGRLKRFVNGKVDVEVEGVGWPTMVMRTQSASGSNTPGLQYLGDLLTCRMKGRSHLRARRHDVDARHGLRFDARTVWLVDRHRRGDLGHEQ